MTKLFFLISLLILVVSCENITNEGEVNNNSKYPTKVGYEWEYNTTMKFELYDTLGHIDSTSFQDLGNTIVKVTKEFDTLGNFSNLIRFDVYDVSTPQNVNKMWYLNNDSGLTAVAYYNSGASLPVLPKNGRLTIEQIKTLLKISGLLSACDHFSNSISISTDSILYYSPSRKVLKYPIKIGAKWTELNNPFYRERFVSKKQIVNSSYNSYDCYKIESIWQFSNTEYNDYISLNSGLVMREYIVDSIMITSTTNPDSGRYANIIQTSKLVRKSK